MSVSRLAWPLFALFFPGLTIAQEAPIFFEENGLVVMEIESAPAAEGWTAATTISDYSGTTYYEWTGPDRFAKASAGDGTLTYTFRITTPGNYQLQWRSYIAQGTSATDSNDSWVRFPTGTNIAGEQALSGWTKSYMNVKNNWTWDTSTVDFVATPIRQFFDTGDHTLEISGRSNGHAIDRIVLYHNASVTFDATDFDNFPLSQTSNDDPDPELPDWSIADSDLPDNECLDNSVSFAATGNIQIDNGIASVSDELRVDGISKSSLLKFDLSTMPAMVESVELSFKIGTDSGNGTINISTGHHSNWTETDVTLSNAPDSSILLGSYTGTWELNKRYALPLNPELLARDQETVILGMSSGSDQLSILSRQTDNDPRIVIKGGEGICEQFSQLVDAAIQSALPEPDPVEPDPLPESSQASIPESRNTAGSLDHFVLILLLLGLGVRIMGFQRNPEQPLVRRD